MFSPEWRDPDRRKGKQPSFLQAWDLWVLHPCVSDEHRFQ